jgi:hypothetical protein
LHKRENGFLEVYYRVRVAAVPAPGAGNSRSLNLILQ